MMTNTRYFVTVLHYELIFRGTPGAGLSAKDTWLGNILPPTAQDTCVSMENTSCSTNYRNPRVDTWRSLAISQVLYIFSLYRLFLLSNLKSIITATWYSLIFSGKMDILQKQYDNHKLKNMNIASILQP